MYSNWLFWWLNLFFQQLDLLVSNAESLYISKSDVPSWREKGFTAEPTCNHKLQAEWVLSCSVGGYARVDAGVAWRDRLDDQRVHPVLTDEHLVSTVGADGFSI